MIIGIHGRLGSGKDTVYERIVALYPEMKVQRLGFADKLKDSACALLGIDRGTMEALKREEEPKGGEMPSHHFELAVHSGGGSWQIIASMSMRTFLQRYGTEAHRDIFGDDFWVDQAMAGVTDDDTLYVFTDVRFENEAKAILDRGGLIVRARGFDEDTGDHPSERPLDDALISFDIDNSVRDDSFANLDRQVYELISMKARVA